MESVFFGHQSWLFRAGDTAILLDPLLQETFGMTDKSICTIYPFRRVDMEKLPKISAVFLSHEHPDHICLDTLRQLPHDVPVYVGPLCLAATIQSIELVGKEVRYLEPESELHIGNLSVTSYHANRDTPDWESRVYQFHIQSSLSGNGSIFVGVDAGLSQRFESAVMSGASRSPELILVSNNSQPRTGLARTSMENANLSYYENPSRRGVLGLSAMHELCNEYLSTMPQVKSIGVCGGGFLKGALDFQLAARDYFGNVGNIFGGDLLIPRPGEAIEILENQKAKSLGNVGYVQPLSAPSRAPTSFDTNHPADVIRPYFSSDESNSLTSEELSKIKVELDRFVENFSISETGRKTLTELRAKGHRPELSITLLDNKTNGEIATLIYELDRCSVPRVSKRSEEQSRESFSMMLYAYDLLSVLNGKVEFWDLTGAHVEGRYIDADIVPAIWFAYSYFGAHIRQDIATLAFGSKLVSMGIKLPSGRIFSEYQQ